MSLLNGFEHAATLLTRVEIEEHGGGHRPYYKDGETFTVYMALNSSAAAQRAEKADIATEWNCLTPKPVTAGYGNLFRVDDRIYKITSQPRDTQTPDMAGLQLAQFTAERVEK